MPRSRKCVMVVGAAFAFALLAGCEQKTTRKVTVDTPTKKVEIEVEKTEKK